MRGEDMTHKRFISLAGVAALVALAACSGGSHGSSALPPVAQAPGAPPSTVSRTPATATFTIALPQRTASSTTRSVLYVSPSANSIKVETFDQMGNALTPPVAPVVAPIAPGAAGCTTTTCTVSVAVTAGSTYQFRLSVFASTDGSGPALGIGSAGGLIVAGAANTFPVTLGGVIATLGFAQTRVSVPDDGAIHSLTLNLQAKDASGNVIIAPGSFYSSITVATSTDPHNALTLGATSIASPSPTGTPAVAVTYDAAKPLSSGTITATVSGTPAVASASVAITPLVSALGNSGSLNVGKTTTLTVSEAGTTGPFTATSSPSSTVTISNNGSATASSVGGNATFTLTGATAGTATLTISDGTVAGTVPMTVTGTGSTVNVPGQPSVQQFSVDNNSGPNDITTGTDGYLWFAEFYGQHIGSISPSGVPVPAFATHSAPARIITGPDNNLWFTEFDPTNHNTQVGHIVLSGNGHGSLTEFSAGISPGAHGLGIASGADGNLWFAEEDTNQIGVLSISGTIMHEYGPAASPRSIIATPTGFWFTEFNYHTTANQRVLGFISLTGAITNFPIDPTHTPSAIQPASIAIGADGNVWFTEYDPNYSNVPGSAAGVPTADIGCMTPAGKQCNSPSSSGAEIITSGLTQGSTPDGIKLARDGNLWFTESDPNSTFAKIGRITPAGVITEFGSNIGQTSNPGGLTSGPNGNIWFTEYNTNAIGELQF